jgi:hypothetical protein
MIYVATCVTRMQDSSSAVESTGAGAARSTRFRLDRILTAPATKLGATLPNPSSLLEDYMQSEKQWIKPELRPVDRSLFETWDRDKLQCARDLVQKGLELLQASGQVPEAVLQVRDVLADIDAMLSERRSIDE